jgi:NCS2 family nucleobase:cation symporter-2
MMSQRAFLYDLDERPPLGRNIFYGVQCAILMLPTLTILSALAGSALQLAVPDRAALVQRVLLISGLFMILQFFLGHRYPMQEGPSVAATLTFVALAPYGGATLEGGMIAGGACLLVISMTGLLRHAQRFFTQNVTGVVVLLIAFSLVASVAPKLAGITNARPEGEPLALLLAFAVLSIVCLFSMTRGIFRSLAILIAMAAGYLLCFLSGMVDFSSIHQASWHALPGFFPFGAPRFHLPAMISFVFAYLVLLTNFMGSIYGMAEVFKHRDIGKRLRYGLGVTGAAGIAAGISGALGTVPYSTSSGVVLVTRVASHYAQLACGIIIAASSFIPKLGAVLASVPDPVIAGGILVILSSQVGLGIQTVTLGKTEFSARDGLVVGLPVLLGTALPLLPPGFFQKLPMLPAAFLRNGLAVGLLAAVLLEHVIMRKDR